MTTELIVNAIDTGLEALTESDATHRAKLIAATWTPDATFVDPMFTATGHDEIAAIADTVVDAYPGQRFVRTTDVDEHHGVIRYAWALVAPDGAVTVTGLDIAELAPDGRIRKMTGFFGDLTPV